MTSENCWNVNLTQVFLSSHITRSVRCWSLFKAHESLLVYQFLAFVKLGPFHISEKGFYLDKFYVIINILQVQLDCCDLTNFGRSGQIFKRTPIVSLNFKTERLYFVDTLLILEFLSWLRTMKPVSFIEQERKDQGDKVVRLTSLFIHTLKLTGTFRIFFSISYQAFFQLLSLYLFGKVNCLEIWPWNTAYAIGKGAKKRYYAEIHV